MSNKLGGKQGTAYTGTNANQPPNWTFNDRPPTQFDTQNVSVGDLWLDDSATGPAKVWMLVSLQGDSNSKGALAEWVQFGGGAGNLETLTGDAGINPVFPDVADNINIFGDNTVGLTVVANAPTNTLLITTADAGRLGEALTGDTGGRVPFDASGNINVITGIATTNSGSSISFSGDPGTNTLTLETSDNLGNTIIGTHAGNAFITGALNTVLGSAAFNIGAAAANCVSIGAGSSALLTAGINNTVAGTGGAALMTVGSSNTILGFAAAGFLLTGDSNVIIGSSAGTAFIAGESSNIIIGNSGTLGDNNTIRIGASGVGDGEQDNCYIGGIYNQPVTTAPMPVYVDANDKLGTFGGYPTFRARQSVGVPNVTGDGTFYTVICDSVLFDIGGNYNNATGLFTAPFDGIYQFTSNLIPVFLTIAHTFGQVVSIVNGVLGSASNAINPGKVFTQISGNNTITMTHVYIVQLTAGDTVGTVLQISGSTKTIASGQAGSTPTFSGFLVTPLV